MISSTTTDNRGRKRFFFTAPTMAKFAAAEVTLLDMSQSGVQITHLADIRGRQASLLEIEVPGRRDWLRLHSELVWSRREGSQWVSGLRITEERIDLAADLLEYLLQLRRVRFDAPKSSGRGNVPNRSGSARMTTLAALDQIDETKPVIQAKEFLDRNPLVAEKWRQMALRDATPEQRSRYSADALCVWELLNRSVRIEVVEFVFQLL